MPTYIPHCSIQNLWIFHSFIIAFRPRSVSLGTCSMYNGQTSTQALQVVHAQTASSDILCIIVSSGCSPTIELERAHLRNLNIMNNLHWIQILPEISRQTSCIRQEVHDHPSINCLQVNWV